MKSYILCLMQYQNRRRNVVAIRRNQRETTVHCRIFHRIVSCRISCCWVEVLQTITFYGINQSTCIQLARNNVCMLISAWQINDTYRKIQIHSMWYNFGIAFAMLVMTKWNIQMPKCKYYNPWTNFNHPWWWWWFTDDHMQSSHSF